MSQPKPKKYPIVEVEWVDAAGRGGWKDLEAYIGGADTQSCRSAGYMVKTTPQHVTLIQSLSQVGLGTDSITIPRSCVKSIRRLT